MTREEKITEAIVQDGFQYKDRFYKSLSTRMLMLLEKFKSPYYFGGDQLKGLMDYLFIASSEPKTLQRLPIDEFDDLVYEYADSLVAEDLAKLGELAKAFNDNASSTVVEVREDSDSKKK
jgi:hypothetical protein